MQMRKGMEYFEGCVRPYVSEPFMPNSDFHPDFGNINELSGKSISLLRELPKQYLLVLSHDDLRKAKWPRRIVEHRKVTYVEDKKEAMAQFWFFKLGARWKAFYIYDVGYYARAKLRPGYVYQKTHSARKATYVPIISLLVEADDTIRHASRRACGQKLKDILTRNPRYVSKK